MTFTKHAGCSAGAETSERVRCRIVLSLVAFLFLIAARQRAVRHPSSLPPQDIWTSANTADVITRHVVLDLTVDFEGRRLYGRATLTIQNLAGADTLILDTDGLIISRVLLDGSTPTDWSLAKVTDRNPFSAYRQPLKIAIKRDTRTVTVEYASGPQAAGLFWTTAEQSYGRQQPCMYSLNIPSGARSWIPIQDTPAVRMTYEATLRVPSQMLALMSAENNPRTRNESGVYTFRMTRPIPAYQMALAVGRLDFRSLDERTGFYAEPELIEDAEWELQYVPRMLDVGEQIVGTHPFTRSDLVLMPPTFESNNGIAFPMLTFVNPFVIVSGNHPAQPDPQKQLLLARLLAHSWADVAAPATWNDVWLSIGLTEYLSLRMIEEVTGPEMAQLSYYLHRRELGAAVNDPNIYADSALHSRVLHPLFGYTLLSVYKGELFLRTLEDLLGRFTLDSFLRRWFEKYAFQWVDDRRFVQLIEGYVPATTDVRVHEWIYERGLPSNVTAATSSEILMRTEQRLGAFAAGTPFAQLSPSAWTDFEVDHFLTLASSALIGDRLSEIDSALALSAQVSPPLSWLAHAAYVPVQYQPANAAIERALLRGGPNNSVLLIYQSLMAYEAGRPMAREIFARARKRYHPVVEQFIESWIVGLP